MTECEWLDLIKKTNEEGPFKPTWESLSAFEYPPFFLENNLGVFIHWGAFCVPEADSEWYPRNMYMKDSVAWKHHVATYGAHKDFGYKDFIPLFKAEKFDAAKWVELFKDAGAGYIVSVAEHHDGFQMYKSDLSHWNAFEKGPCRDVIGELKQAAEDAGITFCTSTHRVEHWWFMSHGREFESDMTEPPRKGDLYWPAMPEPDDHESLTQSPPSEEFMNDWMARTAELIVNYRPSMLYFDWWVQHLTVQPYFKKIAAFYYNCGLKWNQSVAVCYKHDAMQPGTGIADIERGGFSVPQPFPWQTDTSVTRNSWCYTTNLEYKPASEVIAMYVDTVAKNGNLLLNIGPKHDGTIPPRDTEILREMGAWLRVNGDAVRGAKAWKVYREGPTPSPAGEFSDRVGIEYTPRDVRFTTNKGRIYATVLKCPEDGRFDIVSLAERTKEKKPLYWGKITAVKVLGHEGEITWHADGEGLHVFAPGMKSELPVVIEVRAE